MQIFKKFTRPGLMLTIGSRLLTVTGFTLLSRLAGFARDILLAALLGSGALADAFFIALRLPNHFRALFAEGAFNAAFVPAYTQLANPIDKFTFSGKIFTYVLIIQVTILLAALVGMEPFVEILFPRIEANQEYMSVVVALSRITFPYLMLVTLVTVLSSVLNAHNRFAVAAGAPVLFNISIILVLSVAWWWPQGTSAIFPTLGHAAAWGVFLAGILEVCLLILACRMAGVLPVYSGLKWTAPLPVFVRRLGPALIGAGSGQIALFADTILAAALPVGAVSALYYADRLYQLPVGLIAISLGTVLLPAFSQMISQGQDATARAALRRSIVLALVLSAPFALVFAVFPEFLVSFIFERGSFNTDGIERAAGVLAAYSPGLLAMVMLRPIVSAFQARGDTKTPMYVGLLAVLTNVSVKVWLVSSVDVAGLALGTSIALWFNVGCLIWLARKRRYL